MLDVCETEVLITLYIENWMHKKFKRGTLFSSAGEEDGVIAAPAVS